MVNRVMLVGRLGKDPEMRHTPSGTPVTNFSVATDERWKGKNGERQSRTEWHNIVVWSKLAEICNQYLSKGRLVYIEGRIQTREWDDRDGNKRRTTEIVALDMRMLGPRNGESVEGEMVAVTEPLAAALPPTASDPPPAPFQAEEQAEETTGSVAEKSETKEVGLTNDDIPF
ncbi:single-stranded DNA-binding protein [Acidobacteria bacterium AH-259-A15]|nr:single-stranded DNA-binding protein [Acidobacteria bacterium AH-259-A15]